MSTPFYPLQRFGSFLNEGSSPCGTDMTQLGMHPISMVQPGPEFIATFAIEPYPLGADVAVHMMFFDITGERVVFKYLLALRVRQAVCRSSGGRVPRRSFVSVASPDGYRCEPIGVSCF